MDETSQNFHSISKIAQESEKNVNEIEMLKCTMLIADDDDNYNQKNVKWEKWKRISPKIYIT